MPWKHVTIWITGDLLVTLRMELIKNRVHDFQVVLHEAAGVHRWIDRYETHGGRPHRHFAWDDEGPGRHRPLRNWPRRHKAILTRAVEDLRANALAYHARYEQWHRTR